MIATYVFHHKALEDLSGAKTGVLCGKLSFFFLTQDMFYPGISAMLCNTSDGR